LPTTDEENSELSADAAQVDRLNSRFYGSYPYPWPPMTFPVISDPTLERRMLNQSIGAWTVDTIPPNPKLWVAGCGTNQAIYTALKFPDATIIASDLSSSSLDIAQRTAASFGLTNITFKQESLNQETYTGQFDYVVCTGVVHHNADPILALTNISRALKRNGILELMVYNRFHRSRTTNTQKAVRILSRASGKYADFDCEFSLAKAVVFSGPFPADTKSRYAQSPDAEFADAWLQPVEQSYTIESLNRLAEQAQLRLLIPCLNQFDDAKGDYTWDISFSERWLQELYDSLSDKDRWQISNLLLLDKSPMLWFFLGKHEPIGDQRYERTVCQQFLLTRFERVESTLTNYVRQNDGTYKRSQIEVPYPRIAANKLVRDIVESIDPSLEMGRLLNTMGLDLNNHKLINKIRALTTTNLHPYLRATT